MTESEIQAADLEIQENMAKVEPTPMDEAMRRRLWANIEGVARDIAREEIAKANEVTVGIRLFREGATVPTRGTEFSAGWDIYAFIDENTGGDWVANDWPSKFIERDGQKIQVMEIQGSVYEFPFTDDMYETLKTVLSKRITIPAGEMRNIKTGINFRIPEGYEVQIRPRSGLAYKNQVTVMNSPGTIDADYDGDMEKFELNMMIMNHGKKPIVIEHGMRIGQMVTAKLLDVTVVEVFGDNENRLQSKRDGGLGHTGTK